MKKIVISLAILVTAAIGLTVSLYLRNSKMKKEINSLTYDNNNLEDELKDAKDEIAKLEEEKNDMEEQLSDVKHFDNGGSYSNTSQGVSYTGNAMESQIDGDFEGWEGETIFKLTNGTIWQQASYDYTYHYSYMPDVIIYYKGGSYYMRVEDVDEEIRVVQIK